MTTFCPDGRKQCVHFGLAAVSVLQFGDRFQKLDFCGSPCHSTLRGRNLHILFALAMASLWRVGCPGVRQISAGTGITRHLKGQDSVYDGFCVLVRGLAVCS